MEKGSWIFFALMFVLGIFLIFLGFLVYDLYLAEVQDFKQDSGDIFDVEDNVLEGFPNGVLFYPNMRFNNKDISYFIDSTCNAERVSNAREAFQILQDNTILSFTEFSNQGQIEVSCSDSERDIGGEYFVAGEGGPNSIVNATNHFIIGNGTIFLYADSACSKPVVALHEILHVLGFRHSTNEDSILYDISNCKQKITPGIIDKINEIYSTPTLPDLIIKNAEASKKGSYLSFEIEVSNAGLKDAEDSLLGIYADEEEVTTYDIAGMDFGTGRIIQVSNLKVPRNFERLTFIVDSSGDILEINENNNERILVLQ